MRKIVIIPAYNEEASIVPLVESLQEYQDRYDFIVINDASTDRTEEILVSNQINHITLPLNLGIGGAVQTGYLYALQHGYDIAIQLDGDGQHDPRYLDSMVQPIESGECEVTIGSRYLTYEGFQSSVFRRIGIRFLSGLIWLNTGIKISDVTSGYRAVGRRMIALFCKYYPQDYPEPEAIIIAARSKSKIKEIPVSMKERSAGNSSINFRRAVYYMIKVSIAVIIANITGICGGYDK